MTCKYLDPYKDDPYGKLKGSKRDTYFKTGFSEAKIYKTDNAYIFAAWVDTWEGITRNFKPEFPIMSGLCAIPIYGKEYEIRKKDDSGKWIGEKQQPSIFEKALYDSIERDEADYVGSDVLTGMGEEIVVSGHITHLPNGMLESIPKEQIGVMVANNISLLPKQATGKLLKYTPPTNKSYSKGGGKIWGTSPQQRLAFIKKEIVTDLDLIKLDESSSLIDITQEAHKALDNNIELTTIYFDLFISCVK